MDRHRPILVLINGISGSGKDTFVDSAPYLHINMHRSDPFKELLTGIGWDGTRDEKSRTVLKYFVDIGEKSGFNKEALCRKLIGAELMNSNIFEPIEVFFYHVRDIEIIKQLKEDKELQGYANGIYSLLIHRDSVKPTEPNEWYDVNSHIDEYDWVIHNDGTLDDLKHKNTLFFTALKEGYTHGEI